MDDVGASSKYFERHGLTRLRLGPVALPFPGNVWFLKSISPFRRWGPYRELAVNEWKEILQMLDKNKAKMTVAVTASWVEEDGSLTPFPEKFPNQCAVMKEGLNSGLLEIANHGLTHCVVEDFRFKPAFWTGNRKYHREFWDWVPAGIHKDHVNRSQDILERAFGFRPVTFVPPGHMYTPETLQFASEAGLRFLSSNREPVSTSPLAYFPESTITAFHDRELVEYGLSWLKNHLKPEKLPFKFVQELFTALPKAL